MLIKTYRLRLYILYLIPFVLMIGLVVRLYYVQVVNRDFYEEYAANQHYDTYSIIPMRGKIYDSEGHELAGSIVLDQAFLNLNQLPKNEETLATILPQMATAFSRVLNDPNMRYDELLRRLKGEINKHPSIARGVTEEKKLALKDELVAFAKDGVPSSFIHFVPENKRRYSRGQLAPHVVGYTGWSAKTDSAVGLEGVERTYETELRGKEEEYVARKTVTGKPMEPADPELLESTFGHSVKLTINESIQAVTQNVLQQGVEKAVGDAGVAICYAVKTGEILSMASYPSFNLNNLQTSSEQRVNRAVSYAIEPGSVMKIITFTSVFADKLAEPFDTIYCENGYWRMPNGRVLKDSHDLGQVSVAEVFQHSSNIGTVKAARAFDEATYYEHLRRFNFGQKTGIDLPSESAGVLAHYRDWSGLTMSSIPMGYEIQLTAVQVAAAVGAVANKGRYMRPHVVKEILDHNGNTVRKIEPEFVRSVADAAACRKVVDLMELVVEKGTGKPARLDGYRVGGKTGTTKKLVNGAYGNSYIASFCGVAPIEDPEVCIYVYVDNPRGDSFYGGSVAAPVFREIAREAMKVLRIPQIRPKMPADELKKTLKKVREKIEDRVPIEMVNEVGAPQNAEVSPGVVPPLKNLTLAEAVKTAAAAGLTLVRRGSGIVVSQEPGEYETIEGEPVVHVVLENSSDALSRQVAEVQEYLGLEAGDDLSSTMTASVVAATSVPLALEINGREVALPLFGSNRGAASEDVSPRHRGSVTSIQANAGALELEGGRETAGEYERFKKQYDEVQSQKSKPPRPPRQIGQQNPDLEPNTRPSKVPVPVIDGTEEIDPTREELIPIDIETPKRPLEQIEAMDSEAGISLYNL